jgi:hypothetical protein
MEHSKSDSDANARLAEFARAQNEIERLRKELAAAKAAKPVGGKVTFKVSAKGAVSVYGLQRWPTTLYAGQWQRLLDRSDDLRSFIASNKAALEWKNGDAPADADPA